MILPHHKRRPSPVNFRAPNQARAAFLDQDRLILPGQIATSNPPQGTHVSLGDGAIDAVKIVQTCLRADCLQLWITPGGARRLKLPEVCPPQTRGIKPNEIALEHFFARALAIDGWSFSNGKTGLGPWTGVRRAEDWIDIVIPQWDDRNPFRTDDAMAMTLAVMAFADVVGVRYRHSPGATAMALLRHLHHGLLMPERQVDLPPVWMEAREAETSDFYAPCQDLPNLHAFDINGAYLAACAGPLGSGAVISGDGQDPPATLAKLQPGYRRVEISWPWTGFPLPFRHDGRTWLPASYVELAGSMGASVMDCGFWAYEFGDRWLAPWYERLRDARAWLLTALDVLETPQRRQTARTVLTAVKDVYKQGIGWLGLPSLAGTGDPQFRPDWRATIIARARANMWRHLWRAHMAAPDVRLVAVQADTAVWATKINDAQTLADHLTLPVSSQLGKWKHVASIHNPGRECQGLPDLMEALREAKG